ncbi:hypothetical protein TELCIR_17140, partial [Teladorsagia circumcincta]
IPEVGGKERYLWEADTDRNDGRDSEAKEAFLHLFAITDTYKPLYTVETQLWWRRGGRPLAVPKCGFSGLECPESIIRRNLGWFIAAGVLAGISMVVVLIGLIVFLRARKLEKERQDMMWRISFSSLEPIEKRKRDTSSRSLQSAATALDSVRRGSLANSRNFTFYVYEGEVVAAHKHESKLHTGSRDSLHWRTIRHLDHENLNRFIGICRDAPQMLSLWKYCSRGSFDDVIRRYTARIDAFFVFAFMKDMANMFNNIHLLQTTAGLFYW